jgi:hypothetical protein
MVIRKLLQCIAVLLLAGIALPPFARALDSTAQAEKGKLEPADDIRQALAKKIDWDFKETPLADVVAYLQGSLKIPVQLDPKGLKGEGVGTDAPMTLKVSGISAKAALNLMLHPLHLSATIRDEVLLVTSQQVADGNVHAVVYDVADLLPPVGAAVLSSVELPLDNFTIPIQFGAPGQMVKPETVFSQLIKMIQQTIEPTTWDEVGGQGSIQPFDAGGIRAIVVTQTDETHEKIANLLAQLRAAKHAK